MMFATFCLYAMTLAAAPIQDAPASTPAPAPKAGAGAPATPKKERPVSAMTPTDAKARARFVRFSKLLTEITDPAKFSALDAEKIALMMGEKVTKNKAFSDDISLVTYESKGFDRDWDFHKPTKPLVSQPTPGPSEFIEGFELCIDGLTPTTKYRTLVLNVKDGTRFTVEDFKGFFNQEPTKPRPNPHPIPPERQIDVHLFVRKSIVVSVFCGKNDGFCRSIGVENNPAIRPALPIPQAEK